MKNSPPTAGGDKEGVLVDFCVNYFFFKYVSSLTTARKGKRNKKVSAIPPELIGLLNEIKLINAVVAEREIYLYTG